MTFYPLTPEIAAELRSLDLTAAEWRLWSYLATRDPFGQQYQDLPDLVEILADCGLSKPTFYRAIAKFEEAGLFDLQPQRISFRNLRGSKIVSNLRQPESNLRQESQKRENQPLEPSFHRAEAVPIDLKNCSEQQTGPTHHPVSVPAIDGEGIGTIANLLQSVENCGILLNKTIRKTVAQLVADRGPAAAAVVVRNAVSAVEERQKLGTVRNPGGLLVAALREGYTSNEAKRKARGSSTGSPPPPDWLRVEIAIDQALARGDRSYALPRLQSYWSDGYQDQVEAMVLLRREWQFTITPSGVEDRT